MLILKKDSESRQFVMLFWSSRLGFSTNLDKNL
jgi:hypothetical protein